MADFEAPPGPPPPKVPEGWIARWNDQYKEWFYVNTYTKKSQWDKPTEPARPPHDDAPAGPPPTYNAQTAPGGGDGYPQEKKTNPYAGNERDYESEDAKLARRLQEEEDARARSAHGGAGGAASSYMSAGGVASGSGTQSPFPQQLPPRADDKSRSGGSGGLLGKLLNVGKSKMSSGGGHHGGYGQSAGYGGYPQQQGYGGYPAQHGYGGGGYPPQGYGGYPQQGYGGGYGGQQYGRPGRAGGGGMGAMGGAALGLGAGMLGGALIADAIDDNQDEAYQDGYNDGQDGGDFDGGDDGGGDF